jgi:integrase
MGKETLKHPPLGPLADIITKYIKYKKSLGFKYVIEEGTLFRFSVFSLNYQIENNYIPTILISDWSALRIGEKAVTQKHRISCVLQMLKYASSYDYKIDFPEIIHIKRTQYIPYIFTEKELADFFRACDSLQPYPGSWRHIVAPVLFRLIYSCGLRVSEATNLKRSDVDVDKGILIIHEAKFNKDRFVPVSDSMLVILQEFYYRYCYEASKDAYFFPAKYSECLGRRIVYHWFRYILEKAGISHYGKGRGPREHDLRHSFCVHALKSMNDSGMDLYVSLPILSTYVGHASITATQYYLRLTAELYPEIINQITGYCGRIIPELEGVYEDD